MTPTRLPLQFSAGPHELRLAVRINEACAALGISRSSLYELIAAGQIKSTLLAGRRVIPVRELERVLAESMGDTDRSAQST